MPAEDGDLPFLPDPYQPLADAPDPRAAPSPGPPGAGAPRPRPVLSPLAASALLSALLLGPLGAILAILFGYYARRDVEASGGKRSGFAMATVGMALGLILTPAWGAALSYVVLTRSHRVDPAGASPEPEASAAALPTPGPPAHPEPAFKPSPVVPQRTTSELNGRILVVELGRATPSLADALARQRAEATGAHQTLVVMTTAVDCDPCRGVDRALSDPLMQTALAGVRLVRVDTELFHEDLETLHIPRARIPGFFLLAPDLTPRDGIDGGEWDADVAANIAPVLGAFVRGKYAQRRMRWKPVAGGGVAL